jgi:hypothetical protein
VVSDISEQDIGDEVGRREWIDEERWHIENATTDVRQFMRPIAPGSRVGDATVLTPGGEELSLASVWQAKPALLITGSISCPPSRRFNARANQLLDEFGASIGVMVLYVIDAHPDGDACPYTGTVWLTKDNELANIRIGQPQTQTERLELARQYIELLDLRCPVLVDNMNNEAWEALGRWPNMAILIDNNGRCAFWQDWIKPDALSDQLREHLNS